MFSSDKFFLVSFGFLVIGILGGLTYLVIKRRLSI